MLDPVDRVLLPRADIATETLAAGLRERGWEIDDVTAYRTVRAAPPPAPIREAIKTGGFDAVCFTSSSTVRNLVGIAGKPHARTIVACIGPQTAETAREFGLRVDVQPEEARVPGAGRRAGGARGAAAGRGRAAAAAEGEDPPPLTCVLLTRPPGESGGRVVVELRRTASETRASAGSVVVVTEPDGMDELRARLRRAEKDAAAARILAGGADRDVGEIRTELREFRSEMRSEFVDVRAGMRGFRDQNNRVLSAMREDLTDLRTDMDEGFRKMHEGFRVIDDKFVEVYSGVLDGQAALEPAGIADMLEVLIRRQGDDSTDRT